MPVMFFFLDWELVKEKMVDGGWWMVDGQNPTSQKIENQAS